VDIADRTHRYFERVDREVFVGDPAANPALKVEVVESSEVSGMPTLVLITPWTLNGMLFGAPDDFPVSLKVAGKRFPVFAHTLEELGPYHAINLVPDVSGLASQDAARKVAHSYAEPFRAAVLRALEETEVEAPDRRELLRDLFSESE
jgi:hypothetical protein